MRYFDGNAQSTGKIYTVIARTTVDSSTQTRGVLVILGTHVAVKKYKHSIGTEIMYCNNVNNVLGRKQCWKEHY